MKACSGAVAAVFSSRAALVAALAATLVACGSGAQPGEPAAALPAGETPLDSVLDLTPVAASVLASTRSPVEVAFDSKYVYWVDYESHHNAADAALSRVPFAGGTPEVLATGQGADSLAVAGGTVYWNDTAYHHIYATLTGAGTTTTFATLPSTPGSLQASGSDLYWADDAPYAYTYSIVTAPLDGGTPTTLFSLSESLRPYPSTGDVHKDASFFYWGGVTCLSSGCGVIRVPITGGAVTTLALDESGYGITIDATYAYFGTAAGISRVPLAGGTEEAIVTEPGVRYIVATTKYLFFSAGTDIFRAPIGGGSPHKFATCPADPSDLKAHGSALYWPAGSKIYTVAF